MGAAGGSTSGAATSRSARWRRGRRSGRCRRHRTGRTLTSLNNGLFRSLFAGQASDLVAPRLRVLGRRSLVLNPRRFRAVQAPCSRLGPIARLAWAKAPPCQAVRLRDVDGRSCWGTCRDGLPAGPDVLPTRKLPCVHVGRLPGGARREGRRRGDFNLVFERSQTLLDGARLELLETRLGIDHVLARNAEARPPRPLAARAPPPRRRVAPQTTRLVDATLS